jgi:hypothetical protein
MDGIEPIDAKEVRITEIKRLIEEFEAKFQKGVADADNFIKMSEIEMLWGELQTGTNNIYSDMVRELLSTVDERALIRKKKESTGSKE